MAIDHGKLERLIKVPSDGWGYTYTNGVGKSDIRSGVMASSSGYWSSGTTFASILETELDAAAAAATITNNHTVTVAAGEDGTGQITITADTNNFALTSIDADFLGLIGGTSGDWNVLNTSKTSTNSVKGVWMPSCPIITPYGAGDDGSYHSDAVTTVNPAGYVKTITYNRMQTLWARWDAVSRARSRIVGETLANQSFEQFYLDCILAETTWADSPSGPIRLHWDADDDATFVTVKVGPDGTKSLEPAQLREGWIELWTIELNQLIKAP